MAARSKTLVIPTTLEGNPKLASIESLQSSYHISTSRGLRYSSLWYPAKFSSMQYMQDAIIAQHSALRDVFSVKNMENYIRENRLYDPKVTTSVEPVITGWETLVAPYTPPICLNLSPHDPILNCVSILLSAFTFTPQTPYSHFHSKVLPLWPSIWVWLQILHNDKMRYSSLHGAERVRTDSRLLRYGSIISVFLCFVYRPQGTLTTVVTRTEGVMTMIASMWIEESKDTSLGYRTSNMLVRKLDKGIAPSYDLVEKLLQPIVVGCGSKEDTVKQLFGRMKTNLNRDDPDLTAIALDLTFITHQFILLDGPKMLQDTLLSVATRTAVYIVDIFAILLRVLSNRMQPKEPESKPMETSPDIAVILYPFPAVCCVFRSLRAYEHIAQFLQTSFSPLVARAALVCRPTALAGRFNHELVSLLEILGRFAIHRPFLSAMNRGLIAAFKTDGVPGGPIGNSLRDFQTSINHWAKMERKYHGSRSGLIVCGDPECVVFDSRNQLRRCSGCYFVFYCSRVCQRRHWHGDHKRLCHSMRDSDKEPIRFSGPNLRWLAYVISSDAQGVPPSDPHSAGMRPLLVLDYDCGTNARVEADVIDLESRSLRAFVTRKYSARVPKLEDMWQLYGIRRARLSETPYQLPSRTSIPVLAFVPRGWQGEGKIKISQALVAMLFEETNTVGGAPVTNQYLRWLHYI